MMTSHDWQVMVMIQDLILIQKLDKSSNDLLSLMYYKKLQKEYNEYREQKQKGKKKKQTEKIKTARKKSEDAIVNRKK